MCATLFKDIVLYLYLYLSSALSIIPCNLNTYKVTLIPVARYFQSLKNCLIVFKELFNRAAKCNILKPIY